MTLNKRGLGKGLDALLATSAQAREKVFKEGNESAHHDETLHHLPLSDLLRGQYQPRKDMAEDALAELADSIRIQGIIQPLVVRQRQDGQFEIIAGERRYRAAKIAGLTHAPCLIKQIDDQAAGAIALIENIQREDLNIMEEAEALQRLLADFTLTHQQIAELVGKSRATISNILRLNQLHAEVKQALLEKKLEMGHARALLALEGEQQVTAAFQVVQQHLTVRQTETLVKKMLTQDISTSEQKNPSPYSKLQDRLTNKLGTPVSLFKGRGESGKLVINFDKNEKLVQILSLFNEKI